MRRFLLVSSGLVTGTIAAGLVILFGTDSAQAQFASVRTRPGAPAAQPLSRSEPVTFTADQVEYDRDNATVTATGSVEAWQNDNVVRADKITFDRNTNVAAAVGHVVMVQPDGQVLFSDYAELTEGLRDGVLKGMRALLAENGRLVANGARRTEGKLNELSRAVYSTCNLCQKDPTRPPLWQLRAYSAVQDTEKQRIEYQDVVLDFAGVPVAWFPYFYHADPSVKRASGFLVPSIGHSDHVGQFVTVPYYLVLDDQSDVTITPTLGTDAGPNLELAYRRRFNDGRLSIDGALGYDQSKLQGDIFASGQFSYDDTWRYGFDINRSSSSTYLRDFRAPSQADVLTSQIYAEGFGVGSYARVDVRAYQATLDTIKQTRLPYVLPRYQYSYFGEPDRLGGRFTLDTQAFNVYREEGTGTQRLAASLNWQRPFKGAFGEVYGLTLRTDVAGYLAQHLNQNPNYASSNSAETTRAQPTAALNMRWPLLRTPEGGGSQIIEPIVQLVGGPNTGSSRNQRIPNEDSLDFEFTDSNLFSLNRFPGLDRQEGGLRANVALHMNWTFAGGAMLDGLVGQSYRAHKDDTFPVGSGLERKVSDIVTRASFTPVDWFDLTARSRIDNRNGNVRFADGVAGVGKPWLRVTGGYLYSSVTPYNLYDSSTIPANFNTPRNELTLGASTTYGNYRLSSYARRDLRSSQMVAAGVRAAYEDECFIFDINFNRRFTSINGDKGTTLVLFSLTFKTVGQFGFHAF